MFSGRPERLRPEFQSEMTQLLPSKSRTRARRAATALAVLAILVLSGCAVGPNYQRPDAPAVDRYTTQPLPATTASSATPGGDAQRFLAGKRVPQRWWTSFDNAELDRRVHTALTHSPTIASAQAALRQAEENAKAADGSLFPSVDASAGVVRRAGWRLAYPCFVSPMSVTG